MEGGKKAASTACRKGFKDFLSEIIPRRNHLDIIACGGRQEAIRAFSGASANGSANLLLIDSESPRTALPDPKDGRFEMVQCMEAWIIADRRCLSACFGSVDLDSLPSEIEAVGPREALIALQSATQGAYRKGSTAFETLALAHPSRVAAKSPHASHFFEWLRSTAG